MAESRMSLSRMSLSARIALAMTAAWLPEPHRLGDARLFTTGRLELWPVWREMSLDDQRLLCRFRLIAARGLDHDAVFLEEALELFQEATYARTDTPADLAGENPWQLNFRMVGKQPSVLVREWMADLEKSHDPGKLKSGKDKKEERTRRLYFWNGAFTLPVEDVPPSSPWPTFSITPPRPISLDRRALLELASALDTAFGGHAHRRDVLERRLLEPMRVMPDRTPLPDRLELDPGTLELLIAPTATGKSVLVQVLAIHLASQGIPITITVPGIADVLALGWKLEQALEKLGRPLKVATLFSSAQRYHKLSELLENHRDDGPPIEWALERLSYHCALRAYLDDEERSFKRGAEPCNALSSGGTRREKQSCPFLAGCPRHSDEQRAFTADIIILNHHSLLSGRHQLPSRCGAGEPTRRAFLETVLSRCPLVLIDEVDALQKSMIDLDSGTLQLCSRGDLSAIHHLFREVEERAARPENLLTAHEDRTRRDLMLIQCLAQELSHLIERSEVHWPDQPRLRWPGSDDGYLMQTLFGDLEDAGDRLESLLQHDLRQEATSSAVGPHTLELRGALMSWARVRLEEDRTNSQRHTGVREALERWPWPDGTPLPSSEIGRLTHTLIRRIVLQRLEQTLSRLRLVLPELNQLGLASADAIRDGLGRFNLPSLSPQGALGDEMYGFSFERASNTGKQSSAKSLSGKQSLPGKLKSLALQGDPHEDLRALGEGMALGLVGHRRVVLGLSATAFFPGSPLCDVKGQVRLVRPDDAKAMHIEALRVDVPDDAGGTRPARISGMGQQEARLKAAEVLAEHLWPKLRDMLETLKTRAGWEHRARVLLVTGSYVEAKHVGIGLARAIGSPAESARRLRVVQREPAGGGLEILLARDLETFGHLDADVLISPLAVVARGHNILQPGTDQSALGAILVLVRPVPPLADPGRVLAHVSYGGSRIRVRKPPLGGLKDPAEHGISEAIEAERVAARARFRRYFRAVRPFTQLEPTLQHEVMSDVLAELAQLAGRARRGGTEVDVYLVDGAFEEGTGNWPTLLKNCFARWKDAGVLDDMLWTHRAFLTALAGYAEVDFLPIPEHSSPLNPLP